MKKRKFVVRPSNVHEICRLMKIATKNKIPVIPVGGSTTFYVSGGPVPASKESIVIDLRAMSKIIKLDKKSNTVTVEAGVTLKRLRDTLAAGNFWYPHYPESIESATVGGAISLNGISPFATKYGRGSEQFAKLKVVMADGTISEVGNKTHFDNSFMLRKLFSGSEGALGIIAEATLKVWPIPASRIRKLYGFSNIEDACHAVKTISETGLCPEVVMMPSRERINNEAILGLSNIDAKALDKLEYFLFIIYAGEESTTRFSTEKTNSIVDAARGSVVADQRIADSYWNNLTEIGAVVTQEMTQKFEGRKYNSIRPGVPVGVLPSFVKEVANLFPKWSKLVYCGVTSYILLPQLDAAPVFGVLLDDEDQQAVKEFNEFIRKVAMLSKHLDGTLAATVGIGTLLHEFVELEQGRSRNIVLAVKKSLDPDGMMNPGKAI